MEARAAKILVPESPWLTTFLVLAVYPSNRAISRRDLEFVRLLKFTPVYVAPGKKNSSWNK